MFSYLANLVPGPTPRNQERKSGNLISELLPLEDILTGRPPSKSGQQINVTSAFTISTFMRCANTIADGIASVPASPYQRNKETGHKIEVVDHPLYEIFNVAANEYMTGFDLRHVLATHAATWGDAYCFIVRVGGKIRELLPIDPAFVTPKLNDQWQRVYDVCGMKTMDGRDIPQSEIFHVAGPGWNGVYGWRQIDAARERLGLALSAEEHHARMHSNGGRVGGMVSVDGTLNKTERKELKEWIDKNFSGPENAWNWMVMDSGMKFTPVASTGVDAEHLATREYEAREICIGMGVLPAVIGLPEKSASYSSVESMFLQHVIQTIRPWHRRVEAAINKQLFTPAERKQGYLFEFSAAPLLTGSAVDRANYYSSGINAGWLTRNEARQKEGFDPIDGLSEPTIPLNISTQAASKSTPQDNQPPAQQ